MCVPRAAILFSVGLLLTYSAVDTKWLRALPVHWTDANLISAFFLSSRLSIYAAIFIVFCAASNKVRLREPVVPTVVAAAAA